MTNTVQTWSWKKLKMTVSMIIMEIYNDSIYNGLGIINFNSDYINSPEMVKL